jgi:hypothetical protein
MAPLLLIDVHVTRRAVQAAAALAFNAGDSIANRSEHRAHAWTDLDHTLSAISLNELDVSHLTPPSI